MAIGDLTAEQTVIGALVMALEFLMWEGTCQHTREEVIAELSEAVKRVREAQHQ